jgi:hypothetical protein
MAAGTSVGVMRCARQRKATASWARLLPEEGHSDATEAGYSLVNAMDVFLVFVSSLHVLVFEEYRNALREHR